MKLQLGAVLIIEQFLGVRLIHASVKQVFVITLFCSRFLCLAFGVGD